MNRVLIVEDDESIARNLVQLLADNNYEVVRTDGQASALTELEQSTFDLAVLDISLPDGNGYSLCTTIKQRWNIPVIFLTALGDEASTVTGLDLGADDYIAKPFRPFELLSRMKNVLRRSGKAQAAFTIQNLRIDTIRGTVHKNGVEVVLSALEYRLLLVFVNNQGSVLSRNKLLNELWDMVGEYVTDNTLTVYIKRLREKIEDDPQEPTIIKTVRGIGYKIEG